MATATKAKKKNKAAARAVQEGAVHIRATYNNTIVSVTDPSGNVLVWSSAGRAGFSGARKSTPFAAQKVVENIMEQLKQYSMQKVRVYVSGVGSARESAVRSLASHGLTITSIRDVTPIPHNGVRQPKRRRV